MSLSVFLIKVSWCMALLSAIPSSSDVDAFSTISSSFVQKKSTQRQSLSATQNDVEQSVPPVFPSVAAAYLDTLGRSTPPPPNQSDSSDFIVSGSIVPLKISPIKWSDTNRQVTEHAYTVGIPPKVTDLLLEYCDVMGITDKFRELTSEHGQALRPGGRDFITLKDMEWYIQRPPSDWQSNMHWISPAEEESHDDYLKLLGEAGFGDVLASIGDYFELDGLVCFQVTFIGVSKCEKGYIHHDFVGTDENGFNVIIPLILATDDSTPELDIRDDIRGKVGRYKYQIGEASMVGDKAAHATSAVDYTEEGGMRMAATIYIANVNERTVDDIMISNTQIYPPTDKSLFLSRAGSHWGKGQLPRDPIGLQV